MSGPKWLILFLSALLLTFVLWGVLNILVDPFGVFGDMLFSWDSYSQTLNPRNAKVTYISSHFDEFDSYIIGSSSAASYLPQTLEKYNDGNYYNMFHYGADIEYDKKLLSWLLENDDVRHIVLVLGLSEADFLYNSSDLTDKLHYAVTGEGKLSYYADFLFASPSFALEKLSSRLKDTEMPQVFDVFIPSEGTYDKRLRDVESIGSLDAYMEKNGGDFAHSAEVYDLKYVDGCTEAVGDIRAMCESAGAELTVIISPVYEGQLQGFSEESLNAYFSGLAQVTDYWNFSISSVTHDARYFYDATHTRNAAGDMVLARIYDDAEAYYPDNFGVYCENGVSVTAEYLKDAAETVSRSDYTINVPVLLYHHLDPYAVEDGTVVHPDTFASHIALLAENGYTPVSFEQIVAYVEKGEALPKNPVMITFDDGYYSNYQYAFPILREYGWCASIFAIGSSIGHYEYYKDTEFALTPHFGEAEIAEMTASGIIDIQSHTYDMHQWAPYEEGENIRESILPLPNESEREYIFALNADIAAQNDVFEQNGLGACSVMAFPGGKYTKLTDVILRENGYKVTVTTDSTRVNTLVCGLPQSMIDIGRLNIAGDTTAEEILEYCGK